MDIKYSRGSEWRKWDLHLHTSSSYDSKYAAPDADELLCKALHDAGIVAAAITDHFIIDKTRIENLRRLAPDITFFPGVELRTDKGATNLHIIIIFPENSDLDILCADFSAIMLRVKAKANESNDTIYWDFNDIISFAEGRKGLISIHAGHKDKGLDKVITNATQFNMAIKQEYAQNVHFFEIGRVSDIQDYKKYVFPSIGERALIICSDNHDPRSYSTKEPLWIKADPTFDGLIQAYYQPTERIFIGNIPPKLDKANKNKKSYIDSISIKRTPNAKNSLENWFDFDIQINPGLTAIIGNKGSGKSALSDILGHLCKSTSMKEASFLNEVRFSKPPKNLANDYIGSIKWLDGDIEEKINLGNTNHGTTIENAQYLPQNYIENVCNDLGDEFQNEINRVIFSYVDTTEKGDAKNLKELIENKTYSMSTTINELQKEISDFNREIIRIEDRLTTIHKKELMDNLVKRENDLRRHETNKPVEVQKPKNGQNPEYLNELEQIETKISELERHIESKKIDLIDTNKKIEKLKVLKSEVNNLIEKINHLNLTLKDAIPEFGFNEEMFMIKYTTPLTQIDSKIDELKVKRQEFQAALDNSEKADVNISLRKKLALQFSIKDHLIAETDSEEKAYQKYLNDLKEWDQEKLSIIGNKNQEDSIEYLKAEIEYIDKDLPLDYENKKSERLLKIKELFEQKQAIATVYSSIYEPVEKELQTLLGEMEDKIEFAVDILLTDRDFTANLLGYINQSYKGIFNGKTEAQNKMNQLIKFTDFNNYESLCNFINNVLECIYEDIDLSSKKVKNKEVFYNFLTNLNYVGVEYSLKMGGRNLSELSPGERGIVLLVFYLALSKNDVPLIVDQPEDNLDNQSVYNKLVRCICEAKNKRQVIIVTHNPNIAIACDAEQIIYCSIDKSNNNISYISGSIENKYIREKVIDVLEGTMPAFDLRKRKYSSSI